MKHAALTFWLMMLVVGSVGYGSWLAWREFGYSPSGEPSSGTSSGESGDSMSFNLPPGVPLPDFELTDQRGHKFHSSSLRGQVWVASYFFASCPGPCYRLNQALASLQSEPSLDDVKFVSITCDPVNDSPAVLRTYSERFNANPKRWKFLTGELQPILDYARERFTLQVEQAAHSDRAIAIDRNSCVRGFFHMSEENDVSHLRIRLQQLLKEPMPAEPAKTAVAETMGGEAGARPDRTMQRGPIQGSADMRKPIQSAKP